MILEDLAGCSLPSPDPDSDAMGIDPARLEEVARRRIGGEPLQYLLGVAYFYRERYRVTPDCLIPRADTETLVDTAVRLLPEGGRFLDLCTGSGCVAISTLCARPDCTATAVELSEGALAIARENAAACGVADRLTLVHGDALTYRPAAPFDAMLSNPPYIPDAVVPTLSADVRQEPSMALRGGEDGLDFYRAFCQSLPYYIYKEGFCALEIGYDQAQALEDLAHRHGYTATFVRDLGGHRRVCVLKIS